MREHARQSDARESAPRSANGSGTDLSVGQKPLVTEVPGQSFGIVKARSCKDNRGWRFASNQILVAAGLQDIISSLSMKNPFPSSPLGHEIAHFWTRGAGPAANFLSEGWAVYARAEFGAEARQRLVENSRLPVLPGFRWESKMKATAGRLIPKRPGCSACWRMPWAAIALTLNKGD